MTQRSYRTYLNAIGRRRVPKTSLAVKPGELEIVYDRRFSDHIVHRHDEGVEQ